MWVIATDLKTGRIVLAVTFMAAQDPDTPAALRTCERVNVVVTLVSRVVQIALLAAITSVLFFTLGADRADSATRRSSSPG